MNHDAPPATPLMVEVHAMILLYDAETLAEVERYGGTAMPRKTLIRYARWWLPIPMKGDTVGIGHDPEYLKVERLEWWPGENACVVSLEAVRVSSVERFREYEAAFEADGWATEAEWQARQPR